MSDAPGWEAIDAALARIYGDTQPHHWGTVVRWSLGGPDPLDGVSAYRRDDPVPHWHYVSYGLTQLYPDDSEPSDYSDWGFELTFRLRVGVPPAALATLVDAVRPQAGRVTVTDGLVVQIVQTVIRDAYGEPTGEVVG
jgi:hypothetical protein